MQFDAGKLPCISVNACAFWSLASTLCTAVAAHPDATGLSGMLPLCLLSRASRSLTVLLQWHGCVITSDTCIDKLPYASMLTQKAGAGLHAASCVRWNDKIDGKLTVQWENNTMIILVTVYWCVYLTCLCLNICYPSYTMHIRGPA